VEAEEHWEDWYVVFRVTSDTPACVYARLSVFGPTANELPCIGFIADQTDVDDPEVKYVIRLVSYPGASAPLSWPMTQEY
jgi:hypothetical protein